MRLQVIFEQHLKQETDIAKSHQYNLNNNKTLKTNTVRSSIVSFLKINKNSLFKQIDGH